MSVSQIRNADFGTYYANIVTGSTGVGYTLLNTNGSVYQSRSTTNVYNATPGSGIYCTNITFPDLWAGSIVWDTGSTKDPVGYATEEYHPTLEFVKDMTAGRWRIINNQMIFNLFDENGAPTVDVPVERQKV
jgi:hypothetical protein